MHKSIFKIEEACKVLADVQVIGTLSSVVSIGAAGFLAKLIGLQWICTSLCQYVCICICVRFSASVAYRLC